MEYTILDILDKIYDWYFEFLIQENRVSKNKTGYDESYDEDAFMYVYDNIVSLSLSDYEEFSDIVSLLTLEYYNVICSENIELETNDDDILKAIEECDKENFMECIQEEENDFLDDMLATILDYYDFGYASHADFIYYEYENMDNVYKSDIGKRVYKEFHPNLSKELEKFYEQKRQNQILNNIDKIEINSLLSFVYYIVLFRQILRDESMLVSKFGEKLLDLKRTNKKLYNEILSYVIAYFYIVMDKKQKNNEELNEIENKNLEWLNTNDLGHVFNSPSIFCFLTHFVNYDFASYYELLNNSSDNVKTMVKKLTINQEK